jgi:hypothetical protein
VLNPDETKLVGAFEQNGGRVIVADNDDWLAQVKDAVGSQSVVVNGSPTVRAVVYDQQDRTIVHLYSLSVQRLSSFDDRVTPATDLVLGVTVPMEAPFNVVARTADKLGASGPLTFKQFKQGDHSRLDIAIPRLEISALIVIQR